MRKLTISLVLGTVWVSGMAFAEPVAQRSPNDFVKAIQSAPCANGEPRDEDGLCPPVSGGQKGFTLFANPSAGPVGAHQPTAATSTHGPAIHATTAPSKRRFAAAPPAHSSVLSDLLITFKVGSAELTDQGKAEATSFAKALMMPAISGTKFEIAGYTDASGSADRNQALSQARAESVKAFLVSQGVDQARLEAKGYGPKNLAVPANPRSPANRRVEARTLN